MRHEVARILCIYLFYQLLIAVLLLSVLLVFFLSWLKIFRNHLSRSNMAADFFQTSIKSSKKVNQELERIYGKMKEGTLKAL